MKVKYKLKRSLVIDGHIHKVGEVVELDPQDAKRYGKDVEAVKEHKHSKKNE